MQTSDPVLEYASSLPQRRFMLFAKISLMAALAPPALACLAPILGILGSLLSPANLTLACILAVKGRQCRRTVDISVIAAIISGLNALLLFAVIAYVARYGLPC